MLGVVEARGEITTIASGLASAGAAFRRTHGAQRWTVGVNCWWWLMAADATTEIVVGVRAPGVAMVCATTEMIMTAATTDIAATAATPRVVVGVVASWWASPAVDT